MLRVAIITLLLSLSNQSFASVRTFGVVTLPKDFRVKKDIIRGSERALFKKAIYAGRTLEFLNRGKAFKIKGKAYKISPLHIVESNIKIFAKKDQVIRETIFEYVDRKIQSYQLDPKKKAIYERAAKQLRDKWQAHVTIKVKGKLTHRTMSKSHIIDGTALIAFTRNTMIKKTILEEILYNPIIHMCQNRLEKKIKSQANARRRRVNQKSELDRWCES